MVRIVYIQKIIDTGSSVALKYIFKTQVVFQVARLCFSWVMKLELLCTKYNDMLTPST